jgi:type II secretory pathway component PulK
MIKNQIIRSEKGHAVVALLFFMTISMAIVSSIVALVLNNATSASNIEQGTVAYYAAESGAENALLRLIRDPSYTGETITIDQANVLIEVNNNVATSTATFGNSVRKIQVDTVYNNNIREVISWKEIK